MYALTNRAGEVVECYQYSLYGELTVYPGADYDAVATPLAKSTVDNPFGYGGVWYDAETELYQMRHRYYDPVSRRFLSRDPLFDDSLGNLYAPFERNGYSWRDPWGLEKDASHEPSNDDGRTLQMPREAFVNLSNWFARTDAGERVRRRIDELNQFLDDVERRNVAERGIPGAERRRLQINQSRHNDFVAGQGDREFVAELTVDIGVGFFAAVPTGIYSMVSGGYDIHENGVSLGGILDVAGGLGELSALAKFLNDVPTRALPPSTADEPLTLYHYTDEGTAALIEANGLGLKAVSHDVFLTDLGDLSSLQARLELALPSHNTADAVFAIDMSQVPASVFERLREGSRVLGNVYNMPGGGREWLINTPSGINIPRSAIRRIK